MKMLLLLVALITAASEAALGQPRKAAAESNAALLPAARRVKVAYAAWKQNPTSEAQQKVYLAAFPATASVFNAIFDPKDFGQLYDGHKYIFALLEIGKTYPTAVLRRCIIISEGVLGTTDAPAYIHETIMQISLANPHIFIQELVRLTENERIGLFRFLADLEGIGDYPDYDKLMRAVNKAGKPNYAAELRQAKQWRLRQPNH